MHKFDRDTLACSYDKFWNKKNHNRPLMSMYAPSGTYIHKDIKKPADISERWVDSSYILEKARLNIENTCYEGDAFPTIYPNLGPDILGAVCGCNLLFGEDTSWAEHFVKDWSTLKPIVFEENNKWLLALEKLTKEIIEGCNGEFLVGVTDLHPGTDGLVSLRGPERLCYDLIDCPEMLQKRMDELFVIHKKLLQRQNAMISKVHKGSTNWMGIWHPEKNWYVVSSDFSALISTEDFETFVVPGLIDEINYLPASIYHLDGPDALRHLDRLLKIDKLDGVQWVQGAGAPPAREWLDVYKKIQAAGKLVVANCEPADIGPICEALEPEGVHLNCYCSSQAEAIDLIELANKTVKKRRG